MSIFAIATCRARSRRALDQLTSLAQAAKSTGVSPLQLIDSYAKQFSRVVM
jgi:hypothetical protein